MNERPPALNRPRLLDLLPDRLLARRVIRTDACWEWAGWHNNLGYSYVYWEGRDRPVHRVVMEFLERVTEGQDVDHLCHNVGCWNPEHLEGVSHAENIRRGRAATKTTCNYGHDWTDPRNVYVRKDGRRWCAACARSRWT